MIHILHEQKGYHAWLVAGLFAMAAAVVCACGDDDETWDGYVDYTVTSNASTSTTAQINIKNTVLSLYEDAVQQAITDKGYTPEFSSAYSIISVNVGTRSKKSVCDNYIEAACLQLEDDVEETTFVGNIVVTNTTTNTTVYSCVFK